MKNYLVVEKEELAKFVKRSYDTYETCSMEFSPSTGQDVIVRDFNELIAPMGLLVNLTIERTVEVLTIAEAADRERA